MNKVFLLFLACITCSLATHAQMKLIPKGGITIANMKVNESNRDTKTGFVAGLGLNVPIAGENFISIQPEFLYIQKGFEGPLVTVLNSPLVNGEVTVNYLELPLLARVSFGGEIIKAYVNAGPSIGYALGGKVIARFLGFETERKLKFGEGGLTNEVLYLNNEDYNRVDVGLQFGGGVGLQVGPGDILFDVRYGLGLTNTTEGNRFWGSSPDGKNKVFALTVGYAFPLGNQ